jgi:RNA polymerase sigma-70 factor (ECF subfamily)
VKNPARVTRHPGDTISKIVCQELAVGFKKGVSLVVSDVPLMSQMPQPDPAGFLELFLAHEGDLRAFIGAVVRDPAARDDVFQEVARTLWKDFGRYDPTRRFGAWARGIAANKVLEEYRRRARSPVSFAPEVVEAIREAYDATECRPAAREEALHRCVQQLPEKSRALLALRYGDGLKCSSIARRLGQSVDSVYQTLSRLRTALEGCIRQRLEENS